MTKETSKIQLWLPLLLSCMMVAGMLIGVKLKPNPPQTKIVIENENYTGTLGNGRIEELLRYIDARYVDEVKNDKLIEEAINSIIEELDPHSNYISAEQVAEINEQLQGRFTGIGVEFMILEDTIIVLKPIKDGPADQAGILPHDRIVSINDSIVAGNETEIRSIMKMLRGEENSDVNVGIIRNNEKLPQIFAIKRAEIPVNSIDIAQMLNDETGYIKINRFSANTYAEFMKGVEELVEKGMTDLIIDVRQNQGGYLQEATKILSQLFPEKDKLLVYTEGRAVHRNEYETTGQNFFDIDKVAILIDEGSASASEIVAGAIQDWDRGPIIGRRSFGKGLVQEQYDLKDGSALRLTIARYYTPSGRSIQRPYDDKKAYDDDFYARYESGELTDESQIPRDDSLVYKTASGRKVYGGGGITPDVFVAYDSLEVNPTFKQLSPLVPKFIYRHYQNQENQWSEWELDDFLTSFQVDEPTFAAFIQYAKDKEVTPNEKNLSKIEPLLKHYLKARLAKHLFDNNGFYAVLNQKDPDVLEALKTLALPNPLVEKQEMLKEDDF